MIKKYRRITALGTLEAEHGGHMKCTFTAVGSGKSNDQCEAAAWREINRKAKERGGTFRARAFNVEAVDTPDE